MIAQNSYAGFGEHESNGPIKAFGFETEIKCLHFLTCLLTFVVGIKV